MAVDYTFARPSPATVVDHEGIVRNCKIDEARFQGARRVENIPDVTAAYATGTVTRTYLGNGEYEAIGFDAPSEVDVFRLPGYKIGQYVSNEQYRFSFDIKCELEEDIGKPLRASTLRNSYTENVGHVFGIVDFELGSEYQRITTSIATNGPAATGIKTYISGANVATTGNVYIKNLMLEFVTSQSNQNPSEYVSNGLGEDHGCGKNVDGVKYFDYKNGNTVDANGVVTEAKGSAISGIAYLNEASSTNQITNSDDLNIWTAASGATIVDEETVDFNESSGARVYFTPGVGNLVDKTFSAYVKGTPGDKMRIGIAYASFGEAIFTEITLSDEWVRHEVMLPEDATDFTPVLFIVNGDAVAKRIYCKHTQLEEGSSASSFIPTDGAAVTREADTLSYSNVAVNHDFVAACDVTPINEPESTTTARYYASGTNSSNDIRTQAYVNSDIYPAGAGPSGLAFSSDVDHLITDKQRHKLVHTAYQEGADVPGKIVLNGVIEYTETQVGMTLNHTDSNIMDVGNRIGANQLPCLYHTFQLFDQPLTDEQLTYLSKPGNNPKGCS